MATKCDAAVAWKPARISDLPLLCEMAKPFYRHERLPYDEKVFRDTIGRIIRDPRRGRVWLIRHKGDVAGYAVVCRGYSVEYGGDTAMIDELYVRSARRGRGIGSATLAFLRDYAVKAGLAALQLEVVRGNDRALKLYKRSGFSDQGRTLLVDVLA